ncbi:2808_t:CDS:2 [Paraglomus brasilianum]|uniref:2808_t:CDS:1 n=1 Tax=Paraglomus brasilianum TaxID=144538 RepID=A0A9N8YZK9_9GLOM|nr:2808_t:CDS:2 [Paraglomus brasilianum]
MNKSSIKSVSNYTSKTVKVVFIALLLDILAFTIILPLFPRLLEEYKAREEGDESTLLSWCLRQIRLFRSIIGGTTGNNPKWDIVLLGGALGSLYSLLQFVASPIIGAFSDKYGRRATLLVTMIGNILSTCLWVFAKSFGWFVCSRIVGGLSEGNVQLSIAIVSDVTTQESRSKGLALVGIAFAISFTIGPAIGAYFASKNLAKTFPSLVEWGLNPYSAPAFVALVLLTVETLYLHAFLPETANLREEKTASDDGSTKDSTSTSKSAHEAAVLLLQMDRKRAQRLKTLRLLKLIHFLYLFIFSGMEFTLTFLTFDLFDFSNMQNGILLGFIGILSAIIQGGYVRRKAHSIGEKRIVMQGISGCAIGLGVIGSMTLGDNGIGWLYIGATFLAFTSATVVNCLTSLASMQCDELVEAGLKKGQALGEFRSLGQLGRAIGPIAACSLYWMVGSKSCYIVGAVAMLFIFSIFATFVPEDEKITEAAKSKSE